MPHTVDPPVLAQTGQRRLTEPGPERGVSEGAGEPEPLQEPVERVAFQPRVAAVQLSFDKTAELRAARAGAKRGTILAESQNLARDLSNAPGNALPPAQLAREAQKVAKEVGLRVRVLGTPELRKRKMGAILAVGGGGTMLPAFKNRKIDILTISTPHPERMISEGHGFWFVNWGAGEDPAIKEFMMVVVVQIAKVLMPLIMELALLIILVMDGLVAGEMELHWIIVMSMILRMIICCHL